MRVLIGSEGAMPTALGGHAGPIPTTFAWPRKAVAMAPTKFNLPAHDRHTNTSLLRDLGYHENHVDAHVGRVRVWRTAGFVDRLSVRLMVEAVDAARPENTVAGLDAAVRRRLAAHGDSVFLRLW